jgi:hypothetical protein
MTRARILSLVAVLVVVIAVWLVLARNCPDAGIAFTTKARNLHRLKNRSSTPETSDFDLNVTLDQLLQPGDDRTRWTTEHAARIQGEVIDVAYARPEATNCFSPCRRDIHILVANKKGAAKNQQIVVEVTPRLQQLSSNQGIDWSAQHLHDLLVGHWCEFEGWLYFDVGHTDEAENTAAHNPTNWRATSWEIHPVTRITVIR